MEPNFQKDAQNNTIKISEFSASLFNTEGQDKLNSTSQNNNCCNSIQISEGPKITNNISTNLPCPKRTQTINLNNIKNINNKNQIINFNNRNSRYKELVKKIALQLKTRTKTPTQGFFHFAFLKGEYSYIIIKKISKQIINHQIEFNNNIFRIYIKKYYKYKELIKRIAHLLKLGANKRKQIINNIKNEKTILIQNNLKTNIINNGSLSNGNKEKESNLNLDNKNNIKNNIDNKNKNSIKPKINDKSKDKKKEYKNENKEKRSIIKSGDIDKKVKIKSEKSSHIHNNIFNQQKTKTQANKSNNIFMNNHNFIKNSYNRNYISDKRINPINPFIASKEKILNLKKHNNFSKNRNKTNNNIPNNNNQNSKIINVNIKSNHNINNNEIIKIENNIRIRDAKEEVSNNRKDKQFPAPIFSETPFDSKFAELKKDIEIEDNFQKISPINNDSNKHNKCYSKL